MDDSVIKVLRRNGSWTNSKSLLTKEQSKKEVSKNSDEDFSLDKNFGILAEEIKKRMQLKKKIKDTDKLKFINDEYLILKKQLDENINLSDPLKKLYEELKAINTKLWDIEDNKRMCEKNSDFGENFIKLSRDVHFLNDDRAKIKLAINNQTGSKIKEIKQYTNY